MSPADGSLRFLVVDDNDDIRDVLVRMVERLGHTASTAADGVEAVEILAEHRFDFMLLDLTMPRMTGDEVVRWLHAHPDRGEGLRVVVVSAWVAPIGVSWRSWACTRCCPSPSGRSSCVISSVAP